MTKQTVATTGSGTGARRLLAGRCRQMLRLRRAVLKRADPAAVHDLRVASRRLQEALDFFRPFLPDRLRRRLDRRARRLRRELGEMRNADVLAELAGALMKKASPAGRRALRLLRARQRAGAASLRDRRNGGPRAPLPGLAKRSARLLRALGPLPAAGARGRQALAQRVAEVESALPAAASGGAAALHALRIAIKRYRYTLEILEQLGVRQARAAILEARELQAELGSLHDRDLLIELLGRQPRLACADSLLEAMRRERGDAARRALESIAGFDPGLRRRELDALLRRRAA